MSDQTIGPGKTVTLHFAIKLEDGQLVDSNFENKPATFTVGDGNLLPGFEEPLMGLVEGTESTFTIVPEKAFGMPSPANVQRLPRAQFKDMELEPGLVVSFKEPGGELPGVVKSFDDQVVHIDFNHPLAGKTLLFDVKILQVG
uniref:FKBP-type peptidyl-prolyl cis-trans isomerase n=1 Tax=Marinobacterium profundum TaxID=1714300 RepID=UPI00082E9F51|nr:peptidylprolyl isomerase [Marinobacterium profundum]